MNSISGLKIVADVALALTIAVLAAASVLDPTYEEGGSQGTPLLATRIFLVDEAGRAFSVRWRLHATLPTATRRSREPVITANSTAP